MPQSWYEGFPIKRIGLRPYLVVWGNILRAFHRPVFDHVRYCQKLHSGKGGEQSDTYIYRNVDEFNTMYHVGNANLPVSLGVWQRANKHVSQSVGPDRYILGRPTERGGEQGILPWGPQTCFEKGAPRGFLFYLSGLHLLFFPIALFGLNEWTLG